jgi:ribonuclease Z
MGNGHRGTKGQAAATDRCSLIPVGERPILVLRTVSLREVSNVTRVHLLWLSVAIVVASLSPRRGHGQEMKVTLLGTGCPPAVMNRFGPSTLVEAGDQKFVFDAGRGALQRLTQLGVRWADVQGVFLTHLHSDHVVGFPDLWLTGWLIAPGRNIPLPVWGPAGTSTMMAHLEQAYQYDIGVRIENEHLARDGSKLLPHDVGEGTVYDRGGVKVSAFEVDHAPVKPALGYRIDYAGHSVVLSGDTRLSQNLMRHAQAVDLLVHEVFVPKTLEQAGVSVERAKSIVAYHTTPEEAGQVFARTKPRLAVYSHVCLPTADAGDLLAATRKTYSGPLEVGEDLMVIDVGEKVSTRRPAPPAP